MKGKSEASFFFSGNWNLELAPVLLSHSVIRYFFSFSFLFLSLVSQFFV